MEGTIDNLSISVTASADSAIKVFDRLAASAGKVKTAAKRAAGGMGEYAQAAKDAGTETKTAGEESGSAAQRLRSFGKSAEDSGKAAKRGTSGINSFWQSLKRIAYYRFIRTALKDIGQAFKEGIFNLYQWSSAVNGHFAASMDRLATSSQYLKNSLGAMASPLIETLIPVLDVIIDKVVDVLNFFNMLVSAVSGSDTYTVAKKAAAVWDDSATKTEKTAKSAANELKRTILGFDEINQLAKQTSYSGGGGSSIGKTTPNYGVMFEEKPLTGGFKGFSNAIENALQDTLSRLGLIVSGATLAVGAILTFSGANVPLGLAMMAAGAAGLVSIIAMNWNGLSADVKLAIGAVELAAGGSLLALGAIIAFSSANVPLGIAMMAAGAISIASAIGLNWDFLTGKVSVSTKGIITALSLGSIAVGAILAFSGISPSIGIALMAAGITGTAIVPNWGFIVEKLKGPIGDVTLLVSTATLMLGMIAIAGGRIPMGVGLLIAGSMGIATTIAARWDRLEQYLEGPIGKITGLLGAASLVLGFVAIAGGCIPLGLGLIIVGSSGLATTIAARWDRLKGYLEGPIGDLTAMLSGASLILGFAAIAAGRIPLGLGLMVLGATGLATTIAARWDRLNSYIEGPLGVLTAAISGALLVLGFAAISAGRIPLGLGLMVTGSAGLATTIAARWNRLQDYIGGPLGTLSLLLSGATLILGFTAIAAGRIPLGVGLIVSGAAGIATNLPAQWNILQQKLQGPIGIITGIISGATLLLGILALFGGNIPLGLGLILSGATGIVSTIAANWDNLKQLGIDAINKVEEGWNSVRTFFELNILPTTENKWLAGFLGINTPSEKKRIIEEDAGALNYAINDAQQNNIDVGVNFVSSDKPSYKNSKLGDYIENLMSKASPEVRTKVSAIAGKWMELKNRVLKPITGDTTTKNKVIGAAGAGMRLISDIFSAVTSDTTTKNKVIGVAGAGMNFARNLFSAITGDTTTKNTVNGAAGTGMRAANNKFSAITTDTSTVNTVNGAAGVGMALNSGKYTAITGNTATINTVNGNPGTAMEWSRNNVGAFAAKVADVSSTNTVNAAAGVKMSGTNSYSLSAITSDTTTTNTVNAVAGLKMSGTNSYSLSALVSDTTSKNTVNVVAGSYLSGMNAYSLKPNVSDTTASVYTELKKYNWTTIGSFVGTAVDVLTYLGKGNWTTLNGFTGNYVDVLTWLGKGNWTTLEGYIGSWVDVLTYLTNRGSNWSGGLLKWITGNASGTISIVANLVAGVVSGFSAIFGGGRAKGGVVTVNGVQDFASGGLITKNAWKKLPKYAGGTSRAHGTMFLAGEAGPEIVGHVGGRTEVLNKSQLAATMYAAVQAAMAPASANFANAAAYMYQDTKGYGEDDMEALMELVRAGSEATQRQNELLRQQNEYLRQINDKDFNQEITASDITRALNRRNRRAGTTIIPVGT